jgi:hypothetical protein
MRKAPDFASQLADKVSLAIRLPSNMHRVAELQMLERWFNAQWQRLVWRPDDSRGFPRDRSALGFVRMRLFMHRISSRGRDSKDEPGKEPNSRPFTLGHRKNLRWSESSIK